MKKLVGTLILIATACCGYAGLTCDYRWDVNLGTNDLRYIKLWALEEYAKLQLEYNRLAAFCKYCDDALTLKTTQERMTQLAAQMTQLKLYYIDAIAVDTPKIIGRIPQ